MTKTTLKIQFLKADLQQVSEQIMLKELNIKKDRQGIRKLLKKRNVIEKQLLELQ